LGATGSNTATGCGEPVPAAASCEVTVTLNEVDGGDVTVTTSAAFEASHVVGLTLTVETQPPIPAEEDDGCAAVPGSSLMVLLALLAWRRCSAPFALR
jgi:hypothetical protein